MIPASARPSSDALVWSLVLVLGIAVLGATIFALRRWLFSSMKSTRESPFSLQHLRDLRAAGQITEEEFQRLKGQVIGAATSVELGVNDGSGGASRSFDAARNQIKRAGNGRR